jgi:hypothetical protein
MVASYDETLGYLERNYLTLEQLTAASGVAAARLQELIGAGCLPAHSHEATFSLRVEARINGSHPTEDKCVQFFHRDLIQLAAEADQLARRIGIEAAARALRERHDAAVAAEGSLELGSPAHRDLADRAWAAWRDGTFGVCLRRVSTADMIRKVMATEQMKSFLQHAAAEGCGVVDGRALAAALERYAAVTGPFGPHEREGSTRALVYEPALSLNTQISEHAS